MNEAQVVLAGYVAREPRYRKTHNGYSYTSLRVGYTPRRMDRDSGEWSDGGTSFVTVFCWRGLAENVAMCVRKGDPVLVKGKLQVRPYTDKDGASRVAVEVEASSIGHDLTRGVAMFQRALRPAGETALERAASVAPPGEAGAGEAGTGEAGTGEAGTGEAGADEAGADEMRPAGPAAGDGIQGTPPAGMFAEDAVAALAGADLPDGPDGQDGPDSHDGPDAEDGDQAAELAEPGPGGEPVGAAAPF
jgi:single-strand DNA-binding protein